MAEDWAEYFYLWMILVGEGGSVVVWAILRSSETMILPENIWRVHFRVLDLDPRPDLSFFIAGLVSTPSSLVGKIA